MYPPEESPSSEVDVRLLADKLEIMELVGLERLWRDIGEWDKVAEAYTDDATIQTTWFKGNAKEFALGSKDMAARGRHSKHPVVPIYVRVVGDRAVVESRGEIQFRTEIRGVGADLTQFLRFWSRVVRTRQGWRLASFTGIYERGTLSPIDPSAHIPVDWSEVEAASPRPAYQLLAWSHSLRDYPPTPDDLLGDDRPDDVQEFQRAEMRWLEEGN